MYALRERRVHVTQEDFEMAVAKVRLFSPPSCSIRLFRIIYLFISYLPGDAEGQREEHVHQETLEVDPSPVSCFSSSCTSTMCSEFILNKLCLWLRAVSCLLFILVNVFF